jgi:hypothetical protein
MDGVDGMDGVGGEGEAPAEPVWAPATAARQEARPPRCYHICSGI